MISPERLAANRVKSAARCAAAVPAILGALSWHAWKTRAQIKEVTGIRADDQRVPLIMLIQAGKVLQWKTKGISEAKTYLRIY